MIGSLVLFWCVFPHHNVINSFFLLPTKDKYVELKGREKESMHMLMYIAKLRVGSKRVHKTFQNVWKELKGENGGEGENGLT